MVALNLFDVSCYSRCIVVKSLVTKLKAVITCSRFIQALVVACPDINSENVVNAFVPR